MYRWLTIRTASKRVPRHSSPRRKKPGATTRSAQAAAILEESDEREFERDDPTGEGLEHRRSEDTVDLAGPLRVVGSVAEAVEALRVAGEDQLAFVGGDAGERVWMVRHECGQSDDTCG